MFMMQKSKIALTLTWVLPKVSVLRTKFSKMSTVEMFQRGWIFDVFPSPRIVTRRDLPSDRFNVCMDNGCTLWRHEEREENGHKSCVLYL